MKPKQKSKRYENVTIVDAGSEGMAVAKPEGKVVFVPFGAPGDVVDLEVYKKKRKFLEGRITRFEEQSTQRTAPVCAHFGLCGGCKWQHLDYKWQLHFKQKQVKDNLDRIGKIAYPEIRPILGSEKIYHYRNKLEFTFSNRKWLTDGAPSGTKEESDLYGLGFHLPGMFDRILDIEQCHLQADPSNEIRLFVREYGLKNQLSFYNVREHQGLLRNLIIRTASNGNTMVILVTGHEDERITAGLLPAIAAQFSSITSLMYVVNDKKNDVINDLEIQCFKGDSFLIESMKSPVAGFPDLEFSVGPVSFYQTNAMQAEKLYSEAFKLADVQGDELVYDLYTGTGTIALYFARFVKHVVGIEYVEEAIKDAESNAKRNQIENTSFFAGDMAKILDADFIAENGKPELIITDPPRAGMHDKVIRQILEVEPAKIVYISCNPATQARDLQLLDAKYEVVVVQPVDMFPHTQHVENIVLLHLRKN